MFGKLTLRQWAMAYFGGLATGALGFAISGSQYLGLGGAAAFMIGYVFYLSSQATDAAAKNNPSWGAGHSTRQERRAALRRERKAERKLGG